MTAMLTDRNMKEISLLGMTSDEIWKYSALGLSTFSVLNEGGVT
jgi:hypothetical protein